MNAPVNLHYIQSEDRIHAGTIRDLVDRGLIEPVYIVDKTTGLPICKCDSTLTAVKMAKDTGDDFYASIEIKTLRQLLLS